METKKVIRIAAFAIIAILAVIVIDKMVISVNANEIVVMQDPIDGDLHIYSTPGTKNQNFGHVGAIYPKQYTYLFDIPEDQKSELDYDSAWVDPRVAQHGIKIMFNDNGEAYLFGSMPTYFPPDDANVLNLHSKFGNFDNVLNALIKRQLNSAVFNVGPLMSSKESSAERRTDLLKYIEDIVVNGPYKMTVGEKKEVDIISKDTIVTKYAKIAEDAASPGGYIRQGTSELSAYGITVGAPVIARIVYSPKVKYQIDTQQDLTMRVQTSKANALVAQQDEKTAISQKAAQIAQVETEFETQKRKATIEAEKARDVAKITLEQAEYEKQAMIKKGEGEAEYKRKVMLADGALEQKLKAYVTVMTSFNDNWGKNGVAITPVMMSGVNGTNGSGSLDQFFQLTSASLAKNLGLDLNITGK